MGFQRAQLVGQRRLGEVQAAGGAGQAAGLGQGLQRAQMADFQKHE